jgi:hypothetical protein
MTSESTTRVAVLAIVGLVAALVSKGFLLLVVWGHSALQEREDHGESRRQCCLYRLNLVDQALEDLDGNGSALPTDLASLGDVLHSYYSWRCWGDCLDDAWERSVIYRYPAKGSGMFSKLPYELYSAGPNGLDELGYGDDVSLNK